MQQKLSQISPQNKIPKPAVFSSVKKPEENEDNDRLSENFTLSELVRSDTAAARDIDNTPDDGQIENLRKLCKDILQPVRDEWENPIVVTSGFRSKALNTAMKGAATSQHLEGAAADIITAKGNKALYSLMAGMVNSGKITVGQLINEKNYSWIHVSLPNAKHRNEIFALP